MTNHSECLETNDNQMALCPVNMAGSIRLPHSCSVYIFLRILLHEDVHCHGAKLVCHDVWRTPAAFFQCLVQFHQLFIANSCVRFTRFKQLLVYHILFLIPPNIQHHLLSMNIVFGSLVQNLTFSMLQKNVM